MIDPGRARRLRPHAVAGIIAGVGTLVACLAGTSRSPLLDSADKAALYQQQLTQLKTFAAAKQKQYRALAAKDGEGVSLEYERCLQAAVTGDVATVTNLYVFF